MDDADRSDSLSQPLMDASLEQLRKAASADKVPYIEGECETCGEDSTVLKRATHVKDGLVWACPRCRDKYNMPLFKGL